MSEEDNDTHVETSEIGASITEPEELEATPKVSAEKLRKAQLLDELHQEVSSVRELPKRNKPTAQIPDTAKLGEKLTVKLDKRYEVINLQVYQGEEIVETGGGNTNIIHDKTEKKQDQISYDFFDPVPLRGKTENSLTKGKYLVKVHAYGQESGDELEQEKVVDVE